MRRALLAIAVAGCGSFQDPDIVVDLRFVAAEATLPQQLVDLDPQHPMVTSAILDQLAPTTVCALLADPNADERLHYTMTMCPFTADERCNSGDPQVVLATGTIDDPDTTVPEPTMCATVQPDGNLLGVLLATLQGDAVNGLAGVDVEIQIEVGPEGGDPANDIFGSKIVEVAPRIPAGRTANTNPSIDAVTAVIGHTPGGDVDGTDPAPVTLPFGRCVDQAAPVEVPAGTRVRIAPVETAGARETYVVPTLDGKTEMFTEALTYQWLSTAGAWSSGSTGGPHDLAGNPAPLFTDWDAPTTKQGTSEPLAGPTDVSIWIIQRDERLGAHWYESCVRVIP